MLKILVDRESSGVEFYDKNMSSSQIRPNNPFASNISRYFVYTVLKGFSFGLIGAMWVIFLTKPRGLSLAQASLLGGEEFKELTDTLCC